MLEQDPSPHLSKVLGVWGGSYWQKVKQLYSSLQEGCEGRRGKLNTKAWGIGHLCRKPVPGFVHPLTEELIIHVRSEPHWGTQLWAIHMHPVPGSQGELSTSLSTCPPQEAVVSNEVTPWPPSLQARWAQCHGHFPQYMPFSHITSFTASFWHIRRPSHPCQIVGCNL